MSGARQSPAVSHLIDLLQLSLQHDQLSLGLGELVVDRRHARLGPLRRAVKRAQLLLLPAPLVSVKEQCGETRTREQSNVVNCRAVW